MDTPLHGATATDTATMLDVIAHVPKGIPTGSKRVALRFTLRRTAEPDDTKPLALVACLHVGGSGFRAVDPETARPSPTANAVAVVLEPGQQEVEGTLLMDAPSSAVIREQTLHLLFLHRNGNAPVGKIAIAVVLSEGRNLGQPEKRLATLRMPIDAPDPPDIVLYCVRRRYGWLDLAASYATEAPPGLGFLELGSFADPGLDQGPEGLTAIATAFDNELGGIGNRRKVRRARELGNLLWSKLPAAFRRFYWEGADGVPSIHSRLGGSILISSDEWSFLWEMVQPRPRPGVSPSPRMLGQAFAMSRWKHGAALPGSIHVSRVTVLAAQIGDNAGAEEVSRLKHFAGSIGAEPLHAPAAVGEFYRLFRPGGGDVIHIRTHGQADKLQISELTRPYWFRSRWVGPDIFGPIDQPPFIFLNCCGTNAPPADEDAPSLGDRGWPETFFQAGCAGFVATYWPVGLTQATKVADLFYTTIEQGATIGAAMQAVRASATGDPDPATFRATPLAYTFCGHPNARLIGGSAPEDA